MLANVSSLVNVKWYLGKMGGNNKPFPEFNTFIVGIPFNDTNWRLQIAELGETILGDNLLAFQASNEPDLYEQFVP